MGVLMSDSLVPCPFCQEPIQPLATKCRHCKESLPEAWNEQRSSAASASRAPSSAAIPAHGVPEVTIRNTSAAAVSGYGRAAGVLALIAAILAVIIPIVGVLWFSPLAIILGLIAMRGGAKGFGIAVLVIVVVNMIISPTFWLNIGAGSTMPGAGANRMVTYINVFGVLGMIFMLFSGRLWTSVAAVVIGLIAIGLYGVLKKPWFSESTSVAHGPEAATTPFRSGAGGTLQVSDKDITASIKTDLRMLMTAQEAYFIDHAGYANDWNALKTKANASLSAGNAATMVAASNGFTITVTNTSTTAGLSKCTVQVGAGASSTTDGVIICVQ